LLLSRLRNTAAKNGGTAINKDCQKDFLWKFKINSL
jgi:hypothetical protein